VCVLDADLKAVHSDVSTATRRQVEELPEMVKRALEVIPPSQISEVLVNVGHGKYAALRSGIAFAKGFARATKKPLHGIMGSDYTHHLEVVPHYDGGINAVANVPEPIVHLQGGTDEGSLSDKPRDEQKTPQKNLQVVKYQFGSSAHFEDVAKTLFDFEQLVFARDAWSYDSIKQALQDDNYHFYLLYSGEQFAGAIYARTLLGDDTVEIMSVAVSPEFRRLSLGEFFLGDVINQYVKQSKHNFTLEVRDSNVAAMKLYEKLGFKMVSTRKKYYSNPVEDAHVYMLKIPTAFNAGQVSSPGKTHGASSGAESISSPIVLGIESSCDETGVGIVQRGRIIGKALASSMGEHKVFGGVIPELASRMHLEAIDHVMSEALDDAEVTLDQVDAISVAAAPGLVGCLSTGVMYAKGLSIGLDKPIYGVNHVLGHIMSATLEEDVPRRFMSLIVSGGHSSLVLVDGLEFTPLGGTIDDAAGEAFDKVGRLLGLGYPAGPEIDKLARLGVSSALDFPRPLLGKQFDDTHKYDFSFSGLKTAAVRELERQHRLPSEGRVSMPDFCASFAHAVVDVLTLKTIRAVQEFEVDTVVIGGGFSANSQLRDLLGVECERVGAKLIAPPIALCTDNGEMIANLGEKLHLSGARSNSHRFSVSSSLTLSAPQV
jgi:N6-L-threonylcarbamoyladenine synthase